MTPWRRCIPFRVHLAGIIEIMSSALYSRPDTPIRELIQNAHDAVQRRRRRDLSYRGRIDIRQNTENHTLSVHDDGIGLTAEEAEEYLGTLGIGITGLIKKGASLAQAGEPGDDQDLIGQFGIGLLSSFMLADRLVVESLHAREAEGVRWEAGRGTEIALSNCELSQPGTTVTLYLKPDHYRFAESALPLEQAIKQYADFLPVPIFLNDGRTRVNVINVAWFDATPDPDATELALESYFGETPLDVLPLRLEKPVSIAGALYFTPQRTPGFSGEPVVTATLRRMVISRKVQGLLPEWASFVRGVLELADCAPTASREDLVRDAAFENVKSTLEERLFEHLERLAREDLPRLEAILAWHHYHIVGAALEQPRLRQLLQTTYCFPTSQGLLTFDQILKRSEADFLVESDAERVVWYNGDRRQERWINSLFASRTTPCVHALRGFEESLLARWVSDANEAGCTTDLRSASPGSPGFAETVLGVRDLEDAPEAWESFLAATGARILCGSFRDDQPVMAFLNERYELFRTLDDLKKQGTIPSGFQRLIDAHVNETQVKRNEVVLNRNHRLVARALEQKTNSPLASVLRLLVHNALIAAGAALPRSAESLQVDDLEWIADALWGKNTAK
jgi:molecular chaperone HtpG